MNAPFAVRWRLKWLWFSHLWRVQWAHKPLCEQFTRDVLRAGPVGGDRTLHVCRGCACVYAGVFLALLALPFVSGIAATALAPCW